MLKLLSYPLTAIYYLSFLIALLIFHPIQWVSFHVFGYQAHKKSVDALQLVLMLCGKVVGMRYTFNNPHQIDTNQPLIVVANHQSMHDIYPLTWFLRKHHPNLLVK